MKDSTLYIQTSGNEKPQGGLASRSLRDHLKESARNSMRDKPSSRPDEGKPEVKVAIRKPVQTFGRQPAYQGHEVLPFNLVLEGGAMRGQFTAGVLDYFMEHGLWAQHVIGTSAGALNGYNYVAGDLGRSCYLNTKYCNDWRYLSLQSFVRTGNALGLEFCFDTIPHDLEPFDYDAFRASPVRLTTVASNLVTGEADYFTFGDPEKDIAYLIASSAMPLVSKIVVVDGKKLLDGGPCDSVPIMYSYCTGAKKHVVVLTQDAGYKKGANKLMALVRRSYSDYPYFCDRIQHRHFEYNRLYRYLAKLQEEGKVFILRPQSPVAVSSMEKDSEKLLALYGEGYAEAARNWDALLRYLDA
ncbi:MAG: patatin family protein [Coriobacteriaceae bacterium]|jgi:predicted patatin/cPLA2 family phospholipase|nr:patatin family protein [Coriobacteriaceae bacterium]